MTTVTPSNVLPPAPPFSLNPTGQPSSTSSPLPAGGTVNTEVGPNGSWDVAFASVGFVLDMRADKPYRVGYVRQRKEQFDISREPGEQSLDDTFWRRSRSSWHGGAGQKHLDAATEVDVSSPIRFNQSFGIDPWTRHELSLLPTAEQKKTASGSGAHLLQAVDTNGVSYLYYASDDELFFTDDPTASSPSWSTVTGPHGTIDSIASEAGAVYIRSGTTITKSTVGTTTAPTSFSTGLTGDNAIIGFANGFFLASQGPGLAIIDSAGTDSDITPGLVANAASANFQWVGFVSGPRGPIAAGMSAERGYLFRGIIDPDGALDHFEVAAVLPDGDDLVSIVSYLNQFVVMGFGDGLRLGQFDDFGQVTYGPKFGPNASVAALEPQERFVWFGWANAEDEMDTLSLDSDVVSGMGRIDLSTFTEPLVPAYAADMMVGFGAATSDVTAIASFGGRRYFAFDDDGVYGETTTLQTSGSLTTGKIRWSTLEPKLLQFVSVYHEPLPQDATVQVEVSSDDAAFALLGTSETDDSLTDEFRLAEAGCWFEVRIRLARSDDPPILAGWTAKAVPVVTAYRYFDLVVLNYDYVQPKNHEYQRGYQGSALALLRELDRLRNTQTPINFQGLDYGIQIDDETQTTVYACVIEDVLFEQQSPPEGQASGFGGPTRVILREVSRE